MRAVTSLPHNLSPGLVETTASKFSGVFSLEIAGVSGGTVSTPWTPHCLHPQVPAWRLVHSEPAAISVAAKLRQLVMGKQGEKKTKIQVRLVAKPTNHFLHSSVLQGGIVLFQSVYAWMEPEFITYYLEEHLPGTRMNIFLGRYFQNDFSQTTPVPWNVFTNKGPSDCLKQLLDVGDC